jgi:hypothetical protein
MAGWVHQQIRTARLVAAAAVFGFAGVSPSLADTFSWSFTGTESFDGTNAANTFSVTAAGTFDATLDAGGTFYNVTAIQGTISGTTQDYSNVSFNALAPNGSVGVNDNVVYIPAQFVPGTNSTVSNLDYLGLGFIVGTGDAAVSFDLYNWPGGEISAPYTCSNASGDCLFNGTDGSLYSGVFSVDAAPGPIPGAGLLSYITLSLLGLGSVGWKRVPASTQRDVLITR